MAEVPGCAEFAHSVADLESAQRLHYALADLPPPAPITVVGGGLTGIETASELAELGRPVTLICGPVLGPSLSPRGRRSVAKRLRRLGVGVLESVTVTEVRWNEVVLSDGVVLPSAAAVWTAGFSVPDLATRSGLRTDPLGRLLTDETLTSIDERPHRRRRRRRAVRAAVADELPGRRSAGRPGRQHRAAPHRRDRARRR